MSLSSSPLCVCEWVSVAFFLSTMTKTHGFGSAIEFCRENHYLILNLTFGGQLEGGEVSLWKRCKECFYILKHVYIYLKGTLVFQKSMLFFLVCWKKNMHHTIYTITFNSTKRRLVEFHMHTLFLMHFQILFYFSFFKAIHFAYSVLCLCASIYFLNFFFIFFFLVFF